MALRSMNGLVPEWFEPERYRVDETTGSLIEVTKENEGCTRFLLRPLNGTDQNICFSAPSPQAQILISCRKSVIGWEALLDKDGNETPFDEKSITDHIAYAEQAKIYAKVAEMAGLSKEQEKNS